MAALYPPELEADAAEVTDERTSDGEKEEQKDKEKEEEKETDEGDQEEGKAKGKAKGKGKEEGKKLENRMDKMLSLSHQAEVRWVEGTTTDDERTALEGIFYSSSLLNKKTDLRIEQGEKMIEEYLKNRTAIPFGHRRLMKLVPDFLPESCVGSFKLALHIMNNREGNSPCLFHTSKGSGRREVLDGGAVGSTMVNGVPYISKT
jgi:hypothetical protein